MPSVCENLKARYEELAALTAEFKEKYQAVRSQRDLTDVRALKHKLEQARDALLTEIGLFIVPKAHNPYHAALIEAGLEATKTQEQQEIRVDIRKIIKDQLAVYADIKDPSGKPLLEAWVKDIQDNQDLLYAELGKDQSKIVERIKAGMIPIVMPSRDVQEQTWEAALKHLQPIWIKDGKNEVLESKGNCLYKGYKKQGKMTKTGFFKDIPDRPYILWTKPTQGPDANTRNLSFPDQQTAYKAMVASNPKLYDETDLIPTEYVALQAQFTREIQARFEEGSSKGKKPKSIRPLDYYDTSASDYTFTRFLSTEPFSDGRVPVAYFHPNNERVSVDSDVADPRGDDGFRGASRS